MPWYGFTFNGTPDLPDVFVSDIPTGQIFMYPSNGAYDDSGSLVTGAPLGFLRCDGSSYLIADYQELYDYFSAASVSFGAAPVDEFRVPDLRGRFLMGLNTADVDVDAIGKTGGAVTHSHTVPTSHGHDDLHTHTQAAHTHAYNADHVHDLPAHTHGPGTLAPQISNNPSEPFYSATNDLAASRPNHTHTLSEFSGTISGSAATGTPDRAQTLGMNSTVNSSQPISIQGSESSPIALGSLGSDSLPPYLSMHFVIKV